MGGAFQSKAYRKIWSAKALSEIGDWAARLATAVLVYSITGSALASSIVIVLSFAPAIGPGQILVKLTGRWPRRTVLVGSDVIRGALFTFMAIYPSIPVAFVVTLLAGVVRVPFAAQTSALLPDLVGKENLVSASKIHHITSNATIMLGYALGGILVPLLTVRGALLFNAATFFVSGAILWTLRMKAATAVVKEEDRPSYKSAVVTLKRMPDVSAAACMTFLAAGVGLAVESQTVPLAPTIGPWTWLISAMLVGSTGLSILAAAVIPVDWRERKLMQLSAVLVIVPALVACVGLFIGGWAAFIGMIFLGCIYAAIASANVLASMRLPAVDRAAVFALVMGGVAAAEVVFVPIGGWLFDRWEGRGLALLLFVTAALAAALYLMWGRSAKDTEVFDEGEDIFIDIELEGE
jgi:MFS family permease